MTQEEKLQKEIDRIVSCEEELNYFENKGDLIDFVARHFYAMGKNADETIRKELIFFLKEEIPQCSIKEHADKLKEFVSYLEKQQEQKPVGWRKNEEVILGGLLHKTGLSPDERFFLENLRPSWKPSETQIMALEQWLKDNQFNGDARYIYRIFESLLNGLKTL